MTTKDILINAKKAKASISMISEETINEVLLYMSDQLLINSDLILKANETDIINATGKISDVMLDRLSLTYNRLESMSLGIKEIIKLPSPINKELSSLKKDNGLIIKKISVPMGVIGIIFESRPNVVSDVASLCFKSGNVSVMRCGKESWNTADAIVKVLKKCLIKYNLDENIINLIEDTSRKSAEELMLAVGYIDLLIPRGGKNLINNVINNAKVPCIQTGTGICHIYVDYNADFNMALEIISNAKTSRPSVCNAAEVCLINKNIANDFLPLLKSKLVDERINNNLTPVQLILDDYSNKIIDGINASPDDFDTEFLDYKLAIKIVDDVNSAIDHISLHSTGHSETIITQDINNSNLFLNLIDSSSVYVNASTRFTDGGEFGLGCEIGISTQKLHARGPMGLNELCTYKYHILGTGQIR